VQKRKGVAVEATLDAYFSQFYAVRRATPKQQRAGIDRIFARAGHEVTVEYKADWTATTSGNAFLEVAVNDQPGWALTCQAQALFYYLPLRRLGYWLRPTEIQAQLAGRWRDYPRKHVHNPRYVATGVIVPLAEFTDCVQIQA
jgi:hypothetical protein